MNLWFWPFVRDGGRAGLDARASSVGETLHHYWSFYVATSFAWDAAAALANALVDPAHRPAACCATLRRFAHRLDPVVELVPLDPSFEPART